METQEEYLDRICKPKLKPKKKKKVKEDPDQLIFSRKWSVIQAMQQGTYKRKLLK